jgi:D-alanyl-D-alanine carboxypeptidase
VGTPGQQHIKSHHNYGLLSLIAENVTGQDMRTLLTKQLFQPLGMHDTDLVPSPPLSTHTHTTNPTITNQKQLTSSFTWSKKKGFTPIPQGAGFDAAKGRPHAVGGSAYSTAEDMGRYIHAFLDPEGKSGGMLSSGMVDEMLRPVYRKDPFLPAQALRCVRRVCVCMCVCVCKFISCVHLFSLN